MRDRLYCASLGMSALAAIVTVGGIVSFSWALGWAGAAGLLAAVGGFLGWFYWGPRPDLNPKGQTSSQWRRDD